MTKPVQIQDDAWGVRHNPSNKWVQDSSGRVTLLSEQNARNLCINDEYEAVHLRIEISVADSTRDVVELHEKATELLNHLEDVLDDENFNKIDHKLWNAVSMFLAQRNIKVN